MTVWFSELDWPWAWLWKVAHMEMQWFSMTWGLNLRNDVVSVWVFVKKTLRHSTVEVHLSSTWYMCHYIGPLNYCRQICLWPLQHWTSAKTSYSHLNLWEGGWMERERGGGGRHWWNEREGGICDEWKEWESWKKLAKKERHKQKVKQPRIELLRKRRNWVMQREEEGCKPEGEKWGS